MQRGVALNRRQGFADAIDRLETLGEDFLFAPFDPGGDIGRDDPSGFLREDAVDLEVAHAGKTQRKLLRRHVNADGLIGFGFHLRKQAHRVR